MGAQREVSGVLRYIFAFLGDIVVVIVNKTSDLTPSTARLAQSAERKTLNLVVVGSSPTLGGKL